MNLRFGDFMRTTRGLVDNMQRAFMRRRHPGVSSREQRGFSLLEVVVAIALTSAVVLAISAAVLNSLRTTALAEERSTLADDASNALTDLRSATSYDPTPQISSIENRSSTTTITKSGSPNISLTVTVGPATENGTGPVVATATASDGTQSVTEHRELYQEAPAPGSVVIQP